MPGPVVRETGSFDRSEQLVRRFSRRAESSLPARLSLRNAAGFTLIEIMVAVAVLALLVVLTAQLTNNATSVVISNDKRMDADSESQMVFSRMAEDIEGMLRRPDADCFFVKNTGNDAFYFYSESSGYYPGGEGPPAPFAFVGYRIANRSAPTAVAPNGVLERVGVGMGYDNSQSGKILRFLSYPAPTAVIPDGLPIPQSTIAWSQGANGSPTDGNEIGTPPTWDNPTLVAPTRRFCRRGCFDLSFASS